MKRFSSRENMLAVVVVIALGVIFATYGTLLWSAGLLTFDGTESSAKVVTATLSLAAAFIATTISFVAVLLRHSIDNRTESRLQVESDRTELLRRESEDRLKLEASVKALELLASADKQAIPAAMRVSVLFTLVSLRQYGLAISLVDGQLERNELDSTSATDVLNEIMLKGDAESQKRATIVMTDHAEQMKMPECFSASWHNFPDYTRDWAPVILARMLIAKPIAERRKRPERCVGLVTAIGFGWQSEHDVRIRGDMGAILSAIFRALPELKHRVATPNGEIDLRRLSFDTQGSLPTSEAGLDVVGRIDAWAITPPS